MKSGSKTSSGRTGSDGGRKRTRAGSARPRRNPRTDPRWWDVLTPSGIRGRKREARCWLDVLTVQTTNGVPRFRRPGARLLSTVAEREEICRARYAELKRRDPDLLKVVYEVIWEDICADHGITIDEWRKRASKRARRIDRMRSKIPPYESI